MSGSTASRFPFDPRSVTRRLCGFVEGVSFWTAIVLPFLYLPVFVLWSVAPVSPSIAAIAIGLNAVAILVGHSYDPGANRR